MKAIIFGAGGQDGFYLRRLLEREQSIETIGIARRAGDLTDVCGDVSDFEFVERLIKNVQPGFVFHFAADSTTQHRALFDNHRAISTGTINILESVKRHCRDAKVFLAGSAVQFKNDGVPIDEQTPFAALSPYAVSRIQSVYAARYYRSLGIKAYVGYFFNHDSPRRAASHINQKIALAAKTIARGAQEKLEIGNAAVEKEFGFAGDAVAAVWRLVNQTEVFETVIGTGKAYKIADWLELCFGRVRLKWEDHVIIKENFKPEYQILVSNPALIKSLGWQPETSIDELAKMMMAD